MDAQVIEALQRKQLLDERSATIVKDLITSGKTLEQAVVGGRYVTDVQYTQTVAEVMGLPYVDLTERVIPKETLDLIPQETMETYQTVPTSFDGKVLEIALLNPQDFRAMEALQFMATERGWTLKHVIAPTAQIASLMKKVKGLGTEVATALAQAQGQFAKRADKPEELGKLEEIIKGAPVSRMVAVIMRHGVEGGASDIHIEPIGNESRVRYRIDGVLRTSLVLPMYVHPAIISRIKVLANLKIDETRVPQDGRITQEIGGRKIDFRISTLPVIDNEKVVMRILDTARSAPTLEALGFRKEHVAIMNEQMRRPYGMFLVTGPTGSGKSTTLFAALTALNQEGVNISTLEDPVEYYIEGVNQSQVRPEINYTFATGLRSLLRQDPNVIMVGEVRDQETGELSVHASLTGHLVFSTLHTNDAFGIVPRLVDMGLEPYLLAATLNLGVAQRLARKICEYCAEPLAVEQKALTRLAKELAEIPAQYLAQDAKDATRVVFYHGKGCAKCGDTGYAGRTVLAELFEYTTQAKRIMEKGFPTDEARAEFARQGAITMRQDGLLKALAGITTLEEVLRVSQETQEDI